MSAFPSDLEVGDAIHVALRADSLRSIRELAEKKEWPAVSAWMEPEAVLLLIERLKRAGDCEDTFPAGKWATIQRLRDIFERGFWK
jgi:hypothetical protein